VLAKAPGPVGKPDEAAGLRLVTSALLAALPQLAAQGLIVPVEAASLPQQLAVAQPPTQRMAVQVPRPHPWERSPIGFV
jgi:hypothetical protein